MRLYTLTQISIFVGLAISQQGWFSNDFQGGVGSIARLTSTRNNFAWTNTSTTPPEATVEIQFDGLAGSGVINLTSHAGFTVINLTAMNTAHSSLSPVTANMTSAEIQSTGASFPTATLPTNTTTLALNDLFTLAPTTANLPSVSNASTNPVPLPVSPTSANISLFTGAGVFSKAYLPDSLSWLFLGSLPVAMILVG